MLFEISAISEGSISQANSSERVFGCFPIFFMRSIICFRNREEFTSNHCLILTYLYFHQNTIFTKNSYVSFAASRVFKSNWKEDNPSKLFDCHKSLYSPDESRLIFIHYFLHLHIKWTWMKLFLLKNILLFGSFQYLATFFI